MPNHYTTDTISSPGWIRTSDLSHVTGMSCPLNDGTVQIPRPGFEPGTPRSKRGMMVHFTIGASSGRQGSRTLISVGRTALAERPGQPYPATFHQVDPPGIEPGFPVCRTGVVPLDHEPIQSGEWGSNPRSPASKAGGLPLSYPLQVDREGFAPSFPACGAGALLLDQQPSDPGWTRTIVAWMWARSLRRWTTGSFAVAEVGIEPTNSHQALDLAALPICVLGRQVAEAGFEPASNGL
jgi:hypothetical protein